MLFGGNPQQQQKKQLPKVETIIGQKTKLQGDINMELGTIRIDGAIEGGLITAEGIILGENGRIKGDIKAQIVIIAGHIEGDVYASERLEILPNAHVIGDVYTMNLSIAEGSTFEGNCKMIKPTSGQPSSEIGETSFENQTNAEVSSSVLSRE